MVTIEENDGWQSFCSFCLSIKANKDSKNLGSQCIVCKNTFIFQKIKDSCYCVEKEKRKFPYFGKYCGVREMPPNFGVRSKLIFEPTKGKIGKTDNNFISKLFNYDVGTLESDATNKKLGEDVYFTKQHGIPNEERKNYPSQSTMMESNSYYHPKSCSEPKLFMSSSSGLFFGKSSSSEFSIKPVFTKGNRMKNLKRIHRNQNFRLYEGYPRYLNQSSFEYTRFISFNEKFLENKGIGTKNPKKKSVMARKDKLISGRSKHSLPPRSRKTTRKKVTDKIRYPNNCVTEIYLKSKYPGGDIKIFIEGEELRVSNSRNPRPILYPNSSSLRKTAPGNFGVSSMVAPRRGTSSNVSGMNYGARKPELFQKPFCGSVNSKSTIENNPQITNMTSIGLMNAIQPSPSNHKFTALEAEPPMLSPIRSKIQPPKTFFYREFQAEKSEPRLTSMDNANTMNQMKSTQEKHSNNSFMSHSFPVSNSRSGSKLMENATENGNFEEENEVLLSGSDSSDSSFGSVTFKTKQTCGTPLHKWQTNHNLYNNDNVYGRNDLKTGKDSAPANQTLMQDFRVIAYFGYDVAKSIVYFMMAASLIWTCSALMFEVVPFPVHFRDTLYELMSYKKPEPKYGLVVWINKVFRLITKMIGTNCNL